MRGRKPGSGLSPYYDRGEQLKAKHVGTKLVSGRNFASWALGLVAPQTGTVVLDAGCGWGRFTGPLFEKFNLVPANVFCVDSSLGMVFSAREEAERRLQYARFAAAEIQSLPFRANGFDGVMANHVLYHLPQIDVGVRELARVVKQDGWLLATTNSDDVRVPVLEFHYKALDTLGIDYESEAESPFSMENGKQRLENGFGVIDSFYFEDETRYESAEEFLIAYKKIGRYQNLVARTDVEPALKRQLPRLVRQQAQEEIAKEGELLCPVRMGAFVCREPMH